MDDVPDIDDLTLAEEDDEVSSALHMLLSSIAANQEVCIGGE